MWYKSKFFWLNLIAIALAIIQYFVNNEMFVDLIPWFGLAVVILNMVAGMIQGNALMKTKSALANIMAKK